LHLGINGGVDLQASFIQHFFPVLLFHIDPHLF
jgi:hypothetical protein